MGKPFHVRVVLNANICHDTSQSKPKHCDWINHEIHEPHENGDDSEFARRRDKRSNGVWPLRSEGLHFWPFDLLCFFRVLRVFRGSTESFRLEARAPRAELRGLAASGSMEACA
jgi:hypothetical protein